LSHRSGCSKRPALLEGRERELAGRTVASILGQEETGRERQREGRLRELDLQIAECEGRVVRDDGSIIDLALLRRGRWSGAAIEVFPVKRVAS
jgi:hypothetical protein